MKVLGVDLPDDESRRCYMILKSQNLLQYLTYRVGWYVKPENHK